MTVINLAEAFSHLDGELVDDYMTRKRQNQARLARRRAMAKRILTAAACLLVVLSVTARICFDRQYPYIPLENAVGDVSVRYVPEWMVEDISKGFLSDNSDLELFQRANCVFSGTISKIDYIKIITGSKTFYHSIVTIQVDHFFKGNEINEIRLLTPPVLGKRNDSSTILHFITEGSYGIFITKEINSNQTIGVNNSCVSLSDLADARAFDSFCFAFLYEKTTDQFMCYDTIHNHSDNFFASLTAYDTVSVYKYIKEMTEME